MQGPENAIELFHGYTYSGHPMAAAAGLATLDTYEEEGLFARTEELAPYWEEALHSLKGLPHIIDLRKIGLIGAIEMQGIEGKPTERAFEAFLQCFDKGLLIRTTGDIIALSPPLIISKEQIDIIFDTISTVIKELS
jgi:beta-alanine--pyruvate transaminase